MGDSGVIFVTKFDECARSSLRGLVVGPSGAATQQGVLPHLIDLTPLVIVSGQGVSEADSA